MKTGRKSTSSAILKLRGTFRKDRHGDRADVSPPPGDPVKPASLGKDESALWDQVVPHLIGLKIVGAKDTAELVSMCELWGLYRKSYALAKKHPTGKEIRCAVTGYWSAFDRVASKFGLSSSDWAGLKVEKGETKPQVSTRKRIS